MPATVKFKGHNLVFGRNQSEYAQLPAYMPPNDPRGMATMCFQFTPEEIMLIAETGHVWLTMLTFGQPLQPIQLDVQKPSHLPTS